MPQDDSQQLAEVINYMRSHWPSQVKEEWQVGLAEYPEILKQVIADFTVAQTKNHHFIRIAGLSGSGKTSQILPAVEAFCEAKQISPILVAARKFVKYHPHYQEIKDFYGDENLRRMTDEFATIMMFMTMKALTSEGYDIVLDVTLLDPAIESILISMLKDYDSMMLMIATSPAVTEKFLEGRAWRHSRETELEFIRATKKALEFYAAHAGDLRIILWSVYDRPPIYDGPVKDCLAKFQEYSDKEDLPAPDDDARRDAKIAYLLKMV